MSEPREFAFADLARKAVYEVIEQRRDVRNFRPDPVPDDLLQRLLAAAHQAGSVGFMQPWDFIVVRKEENRRRAYDAFRNANARAARHYADDRAVTYNALKLQGVLDAPLGICVTCDTRRGGPHVLGRDTMPETDRYSTCLAIQNLWLAARAEGVGVGWVSIVEPGDLVALFGLPDGVVPIAYLCVGYPVVLPAEPMLAATGWRQRLPLADVIREERWDGVSAADIDDALGASSLAADPSTPATLEDRLSALVSRVRPVDSDGTIASTVRARLDALAKPVGSLGVMEHLAVRLARAQHTARPTAERAALLLFAGDHGVARHGVSAFLPEVTSKLCYSVIAGGAVCNALARDAGAAVTLVDVGVDHDFDSGALLQQRKVRRGTRDLSVEAALTTDEVLRAMFVGVDVVHALPADTVVLLGELGIGNTASASAVAAALMGINAEDSVGLGTGVGEEALARKRAAVTRALTRVRANSPGPPHAVSPLLVLAECGGLEIAALAGAVLACAARGMTMVLDGMIVGVAALAAMAMAADVTDYCVASHSGAERVHALVLHRLGLVPLLTLGLRLGEGTGALLALPLVRAACHVLGEVRTWEEAGIAPPMNSAGAR